MNRRLAAAMAGVVGAAALMVAAPTPAMADSTCPDDYLCVWDNIRFEGERYLYKEDFPVAFPGPMGSAKNRLGVEIDLLNQAGGSVATIPSGANNGNLSGDWAWGAWIQGGSNHNETVL